MPPVRPVFRHGRCPQATPAGPPGFVFQPASRQAQQRPSRPAYPGIHQFVHFAHRQPLAHPRGPNYPGGFVCRKYLQGGGPGTLSATRPPTLNAHFGESAQQDRGDTNSGCRVFEWEQWEHRDNRMDTGFACSQPVPTRPLSGNKFKIKCDISHIFSMIRPNPGRMARRAGGQSQHPMMHIGAFGHG